eukprot:scaffold2353_cov167-Amphora_coffeaeformis.AAC.77
MAKHTMPGSTGISIIAKATRDRTLCDGVIADAMGAGKTVISITLIVQGLKAARASQSYPHTSGATFLDVPKALVGQWQQMIEQFSAGVKVVCIFETCQIAELTVQEIVEVGIVICTVDIIESAGYTANLSKQSGLCAIEVVDSEFENRAGTEAFLIPELPKTNGYAR